MEKYYAPPMVFTDFEALGYSEKQADRMAFEEFKEHSKKLTKMEDNRPKLYGLIMKI
jgi:hypothetical protein